MVRTLTIAVLILPLAIDTFVLGTALGVAGLAKGERLRTSMLLTSFEAGMPLVGFLVGAGLGNIVGAWADYVAAVVLAATGAWILWSSSREQDEEKHRVELLRSARGWAIVILGLSISLDELAIGFGVGLLRLPQILLMTLIALQAFLASQLGMRLGVTIAENAREAAERIGGAILMLAAGLLVVEKLIRA
jgi:manganese efflux pump family protein